MKPDRQIVIDTETTGLDPLDGHRIVETGCIELSNFVPTGNTYHVYINPERDMPEAAFNVHGLSSEFLRDKPVFRDILDDFVRFIADSALVIHNAAFDMKFINHEFDRAGQAILPASRAIDTLLMARAKYPGAPNSLDALCRRFEIDATSRHKHGALIDAELLAEVYLELVGGRQPGLQLDAGVKHPGPREAAGAAARTGSFDPIVRKATPAERQKHADFVKTKLGANALWLNFPD